jgi:uncharacterized OB-fold protein
MTEARPIAEPDDITEFWWDATKEDKLMIQRCRACNHHQHYPRAICTNCASTSLGYVTSEGRGEIYSYTIVHRSPIPAFEPPYIVALVRLAEGPVLLSNIVGIAPDDVRCDMPVEVAWEPLPDGRKLPLFQPAHD